MIPMTTLILLKLTGNFSANALAYKEKSNIPAIMIERIRLFVRRNIHRKHWDFEQT